MQRVIAVANLTHFISKSTRSVRNVIKNPVHAARVAAKMIRMLEENLSYGKDTLTRDIGRICSL